VIKLHEHVCDVCGKPATINYQHCWVSWTITEKGDFVNEEFHDSDENEFYCDDCWENEMNEDFDGEDLIEEAFPGDNPIFRIGSGSLSNVFNDSDVKPERRLKDEYKSI